MVVAEIIAVSLYASWQARQMDASSSENDLSGDASHKNNECTTSKDDDGTAVTHIDTSECGISCTMDHTETTTRSRSEQASNSDESSDNDSLPPLKPMPADTEVTTTTAGRQRRLSQPEQESIWLEHLEEDMSEVSQEEEEEEAYDETRDELCVAMLAALKAKEMQMEQEKRQRKLDALAAKFVQARLETFAHNMEVIASLHEDDDEEQEEKEEQSVVSAPAEPTVAEFVQARASTFARNLETLSMMALGQCEAPWATSQQRCVSAPDIRSV